MIGQIDQAVFREAVEMAAGRGDVRAAVDGLYRDVQSAIASRKPICQASGRCCRFEEFGHRLYVTTLEVAAFVAAVRGSGGTWPGEPNPGGCPFQARGLCSVHADRPFGCRIFFCDPTAAGWQEAQYALFHERLKTMHARLDVPYFYTEWRQALDALSAGRSR